MARVEGALLVSRKARTAAIRSRRTGDRDRSSGSRSTNHRHFDDAKRAQSVAFQEATPEDDLDRILQQTKDGFDNASRFRDLCTDLEPGGVDAYVTYRALSGLSHAGLPVVDKYFARIQEGEDIPAWRETPTTGFTPALLLFFIASSMVWAARAFIYTSRDMAHRSFIRDCAKELGIEPELRLSEAYRKRHQKKRAEAKTPSPVS